MKKNKNYKKLELIQEFRTVAVYIIKMKQNHLYFYKLIMNKNIKQTTQFTMVLIKQNNLE